MALYRLEDVAGANDPYADYYDKYASLKELRDYFASHPNANYDDVISQLKNGGFGSKGAGMANLIASLDYVANYYNNRAEGIYSGLKDGSLKPTDVLADASQMGLTGKSPELSDTINQYISQQNAEEAFDRQIQARDTSLLSTYEQAQQLGINPTGAVMSLGGASTPSVGQASNPGSSAASLRQQERINEYNQKQAMTRQLISMAGSVAASGLRGGTAGMAANIAGKAARATVGAARAVLGSY